MARQQPLSLVLTRFQTEIGVALSANGADTQRFYNLLNNKQNWLAGEFDWPFLKENFDVSVTQGGRYFTLPPALNTERPFCTYIWYNNDFQTVLYGIDVGEYNTFPSEVIQGVPIQPQDPVQRWQYFENDVGVIQFEVWPIPVTTQTFRFVGQRILASLYDSNNVFLPTATLDLDDQMVIYYAASSYWAERKNPQMAAALLQLAQNRMNFIRASYPKRDQVVSMIPASLERRFHKNIPLVVVAGSLNINQEAQNAGSPEHF